jgi:hypothetical protein
MQTNVLCYVDNLDILRRYLRGGAGLPDAMLGAAKP